MKNSDYFDFQLYFYVKIIITNTLAGCYDVKICFFVIDLRTLKFIFFYIFSIYFFELLILFLLFMTFNYVLIVDFDF